VSDIVFMDTETLGLDPCAPVWEFAAIRRAPNGVEQQYHCFIDHDPSFWLQFMPQKFVALYDSYASAGTPHLILARVLVENGWRKGESA